MASGPSPRRGASGRGCQVCRYGRRACRSRVGSRRHRTTRDRAPRAGRAEWPADHRRTSRREGPGTSTRRPDTGPGSEGKRRRDSRGPPPPSGPKPRRGPAGQAPGEQAPGAARRGAPTNRAGPRGAGRAPLKHSERGPAPHPRRTRRKAGKGALDLPRLAKAANPCGRTLPPTWYSTCLDTLILTWAKALWPCSVSSCE